MCGTIVAHETVNFNGMDIAGLYAVNAGGSCNNFFSYCHSHGIISSLKYVFICAIYMCSLYMQFI